VTGEAQSLVPDRQALEHELIHEAWLAMRSALTAASLDHLLAPEPPEFFLTEIRKDPFDGSESFYGEWRDKHGAALGSIVIHAAGNAYAEYDVICQHPTDSRWFVEATTAWGQRRALKSELRLLPAIN